MDWIFDSELERDWSPVIDMSGRNVRLRIRQEKQLLAEIFASTGKKKHKGEGEPKAAGGLGEPVALPDEDVATQPKKRDGERTPDAEEGPSDLIRFHSRLLDPTTRDAALAQDPNVQILAQMLCVDVRKDIEMRIDPIASPQGVKAVHHYVYLTVKVRKRNMSSMVWYMHRYLVHYMRQQGVHVDDSNQNQEFELVVMCCTHVSVLLYDALYLMVYQLRLDLDNFVRTYHDVTNVHKILCECKEDVGEYWNTDVAYAECDNCEYLGEREYFASIAAPNASISP